MVQRNWQPEDLRKAFFPIEMRDVFLMDNNGRPRRIPEQKAIVDKATSHTFAIVSNRYRLVTNMKAYDIADYIARAIFPGKCLRDFEVFNIYMPRSKGSCRIDLIIPDSFMNPFGNKVDKWIPFIRISNSYNKTLMLKYEVGFCRWICLNGVIFNQKGITFAFNHNDFSQKTLERIISRALKDIGDIRSMWSSVEDRLQRLRNIDIQESLVLPIYCKAYGITYDENKKLSAKQRDSVGAKVMQIKNSGREYFEEMGYNAYAMFNVLTDFASFPSGTTNANNFIHGYQRKAGNWADEFLSEYQKTSFSWDTYIGEEVMKTSSRLDKMVREMYPLGI